MGSAHCGRQDRRHSRGQPLPSPSFSSKVSAASIRLVSPGLDTSTGLQYWRGRWICNIKSHRGGMIQGLGPRSSFEGRGMYSARGLSFQGWDSVCKVTDCQEGVQSWENLLPYLQFPCCQNLQMVISHLLPFAELWELPLGAKMAGYLYLIGDDLIVLSKLG